VKTEQQTEAILRVLKFSWNINSNLINSYFVLEPNPATDTFPFIINEFFFSSLKFLMYEVLLSEKPWWIRSDKFDQQTKQVVISEFYFHIKDWNFNQKLSVAVHKINVQRTRCVLVHHYNAYNATTQWMKFIILTKKILLLLLFSKTEEVKLKPTYSSLLS
jgi:hypothetical protein